jgi:hypothetical protein
MELILLIVTWLLLDVLAAQFGYGSRELDPRDVSRWRPASGAK